MLTERIADFPNVKKCKSPQPLLGSQTYYILMHLRTLLYHVHRVTSQDLTVLSLGCKYVLCFYSSWVSYRLHMGFLVTRDPWFPGLHLGRGWAFSHRSVWNHWVEINPGPVLHAPHPPCNTKQCAQLGFLCCWDLHMLSCVTSHTAAIVCPCSPQQPQLCLPWLCYHSHMDCFPSDSNNKSIRAGLASGKWNQLLSLSPGMRTLNDLLEHFKFLPFAFFSAIHWIPSLLISLPVAIYQAFLSLTYRQKSPLQHVVRLRPSLVSGRAGKQTTTHLTSKNDSVLSFHTGTSSFSSLADTPISLL